MPHPIFLPRKFLFEWLCIFLAACCMTGELHAQSGITVYSDTVSVLEDATTDSTWTAPSPALPANFPLNDLFGNDGFSDFFSGIMGFMGLTGIMLILVAIFFSFLPLLAIGLIIYLIIRSNREKRQRIDREAYDPERKIVDENVKNRLLKQSAIRHACWGTGIIITEWIIGLTSWLHVIGVVLLCIAAGDWLNSRIGKRKQ